jgi:hypothetical protein
MIRTIREWLEDVGGADRVSVDFPALLDATSEAPKLASAKGSGILKTNCGGDVILAFRLVGTHHTGSRIYLVRDDDYGQDWDVRRRTGKITAQIGPRPRAVLVLRKVLSS